MISTEKAQAETKVARAEAEAKVARAETERYKWRLKTAVKDLLQSKGLMTSRGIYESLLEAVAVELKSPKAKKTPTCTEVGEK